MSITLPIETAERDLRGLLDELGLGDTVTLVGSGGVPQALLVSLRPTPRGPQPALEWETRWDALAQKVRTAWHSQMSTIEVLSEMRR
jgi:hypothetical protein